MKTIVLSIAPVASHYYASFNIAKELKLNGYRVVYIGYETANNLVEKHGFEYFTLTYYTTTINNKFIRQYVNTISFINRKLGKRIKFIDRYMITFLHCQDQRSKFLNQCTLKNVVEALSPSMFILDSFHIMSAIALYKYKDIKVLIIESKFSPKKNKNIPPLTSSFVPRNGSLLSITTTELLWLSYFTKRFLRKTIYRVIYMRSDHLSLSYDLARRVGYDLKRNIEDKRTFFYGLKHIPEIVTSPKSLEFPWKEQKNINYVSSNIDLKREEIEGDQCYENVIEKLTRIKLANKDKIIYIGLGSVSHRNKYILTFYKTILKIASFRKNTIFLISAKNFAPTLRAMSESLNTVYVFERVPQLSFLRVCNLMINHGGTLSIEECVLSEVPMLCFPLNTDWDHKGNTARVVYYGLGLAGDIKNDSYVKIDEKILRILNDSSYKNRIATFKKKMVDDHNDDIKFIKDMI